ncbi:MAG: DNA primase small subunit [Candidatus Njordarchaeia archaeon]
MLSLLEAAKIYYTKYFSFKPLFEVIPLKNFNHREFGFTIDTGEDKRFVRNISFSTPADLKNFLVQKNVIGAYVGALYDPPPSRSHPITKIKWIGRELIFDLDLTDYDDIRTCGKGKDHYCRICWPLITKAALFIDETLREDFGFENIVWVFSGRRGLHAWVLDKEALTIDESVREAIAEYITTKKEEDYYPKKYRERALRIYADQEEIPKIQSRQQKIILKKLWERIERELPRLDKKVTMDTVRLLRMPGSIHDSTGKIVTIIDDIESFYPDQIPDVWDVIGERKPLLKIKKE